MHWYEGSIADAVSLTRKNGSIFVVYIEGTDEESVNITSTINQEDVSKLLNSNHFVAIKIEANSVPHQQFSEIFRGAKVPSVYFIGKNGAPLDIIEKSCNPTEFQQKIEGVLKKAGVTINQIPSVQSSDLIEQEQQHNAAVYENGTLPQSQQTTAGSSKIVEDTESEKSSLTTEERVEKAKEIIEKKREEKRKEEEEKERMKEIERRKMGQDVQKMKRWQQDQELKQVIEAREKEKREQMEAKQRILDQIKQDKVDRAARFAPTQQQHSPQQSTPPPVPPRIVDNGMARIQFRLPDGSTNTTEFTSDTTLRDVKLYIKTSLNLSFNFLLATNFPKREFTGEHDSNTLAELELIPTAVLLILPVSHGTVSTNSRTFTSILWSVLAPLLNALSYLKSLVFGAPRPPQQEPTSPSDNGNKRPADSTAETSRQYAKKRAGETTVVRRQGNVHRLSDKTDSDDENNTWNGNSTQQM